MPTRTKHQQRNHQQRRKLAHATFADAPPVRMLFQSTRDFVSAAGEKMREVFTFKRRKV